MSSYSCFVSLQNLYCLYIHVASSQTLFAAIRLNLCLCTFSFSLPRV
uniref:Uncharacterized protein n=1 Tax=Arundo donax TaxID=35708 RepID=A0A0A9FY13_ARUDO